MTENIKKKSWFDSHKYDIIVVVSALIIITLILVLVKIPFTVEIPILIDKKSIEIEEYVSGKNPIIARETYRVKVSYLEEVDVSEMKNKVSSDCYYDDVNYVIKYTKGLQDPYDIRTETGFKRTASATSGAYHQLISVCNIDKYPFGGEFSICHFAYGKMFECVGTYKIKEGSKGVGAGSLSSPSFGEDDQCITEKFLWNTPYDITKNITLIAKSVSQKKVCSQINNEVPVNIYNSHRYPGIPSKVNITQWRYELRYKNVTKGYTDIISTRDKEIITQVESVRYTTEYRPLWREILKKLGF